MTDDRGSTALHQVLDQSAMAHTVARMAAEILERDGDDVMLVGIHTRGVPLADRLARALEEATGRKVAVGRLDISLYRDDVGPGDRPTNSRYSKRPCFRTRLTIASSI